MALTPLALPGSVPLAFAQGLTPGANRLADAQRQYESTSGPVKFSYSGSDFNIWAYFPIRSGADSKIVQFGELQTVSSSMASSISPVESIGSSLPSGHTRGNKTFAGSFVFTVFEREPLQELIDRVDYESSYDKDVHSQFLTLDQMPAFNMVIQGTNELPTKRGLPQTIIKVIVGVKFNTHGETISVDDFYLEQTYQYVAQYISPWLQVIDSEVGVAKGLSTLTQQIATRENKNVE